MKVIGFKINKSKTIFISIFVLFVILYIIINRSVDQIKIDTANFDEVTDKNSNEFKRVESLVQNSTIQNAFMEINEGYLLLSDKKVLSSGFVSGQFDGTSGNYPKSSVSGKKELEPYVLAISKYHPFFDSYVKKLGLNCLYFVEPNNNIIIYNTDLDNQLFKKHSNIDVNILLNKLKLSKKKSSPIYIHNEKNNETLVCSKIHEGNKLYGFVLASFNSTQE